MSRWLGRLGLVLGGLALGLGLAELTARLMGAQADAELFYASPDSVPADFYRTDRALLVVPAADYDGVAETLDGQIRLRTGPNGLRGGPPTADDRPRWLAVGDSFTLGVQVPEKQTVSAQLSAITGAQVLNGGVDGYSTFQATGRYVALADDLDLDGVLLVFFVGNDLQDNARFPDRRRAARGLVPGRPIPRPPIPWLTRLLTRHSHLYVRARVWSRSREVSELSSAHRAEWRDSLSLFSVEGAGRLDALMGPTQQALAELNAATEARGDRLLVAIAPPAIAVHADRLGPTFTQVGLDPASARVAAPSEAVAEALEALGIPHCDLLPALRAAAAAGEPVYLQWDGHWGRAGHRIAAEAIAACAEGQL